MNSLPSSGSFGAAVPSPYIDAQPGPGSSAGLGGTSGRQVQRRATFRLEAASAPTTPAPATAAAAELYQPTYERAVSGGNSLSSAVALAQPSLQRAHTTSTSSTSSAISSDLPPFLPSARRSTSTGGAVLSPTSTSTLRPPVPPSSLLAAAASSPAEVLSPMVTQGRRARLVA